MLTLYRKKGVLYAKCLLNLKKGIQLKNNNFKSCKPCEELVELEDLKEMLKVNCNVKVYNGEKFIKVKLGDFIQIIMNKKYVVEEIVEEKKVVVEPKKVEQPQQPKVEEKKVEVKKEEPKVEVQKNVEPKDDNNKKNRHRNNNNQNNNQQEGDVK